MTRLAKEEQTALSPLLKKEGPGGGKQSPRNKDAR